MVKVVLVEVVLVEVVLVEVVLVDLVGVMAVAKFVVSAPIKKLLLITKMSVLCVILSLSGARSRLAGFPAPVQSTSVS